MYRTPIKLNADSPNTPLRPCWVGAKSDALFQLCGVPSGFTSRLYVLFPDTAPVYFDAAADGTVYAAAANFPATAPNGHYEVTITDPATGRAFWCGRGTLNVVEAVDSGSAGGGHGNALETYIRDPLTGLYHRIIAERNEDGDMTSRIEQQGVVSP